MKLAFMGKMGSGKTTAAMYVANKYKLWPVSFARALKLDVYNMLHSPVKARFDLSDYEKVKWVNDNKDKLRELLQAYGMARRNFDPDYWIKRIAPDIAMHDDVVIDDLRFKNEAEFLKLHGFMIIKLEGHGYAVDNHPSETEHASINYDYGIMLEEIRDINALYACLDNVIDWLRYKHD